MRRDVRVRVTAVVEVVEQPRPVGRRIGGGIRRVRRAVAPGRLAPGRHPAQLRGDPRPVAVRGPSGAEGVVVALPQRLPVRPVEAQLHVPGVRTGGQRARARGERDLQIAVRVGGRVRERPERPGDVPAALHRPGAGEPVGRRGRIGLEVVPDPDVVERHTRTAGVAHLQPGFALVGRRARRTRAVLDDESVGGSCGTGGRGQYGEGGTAQCHADGGSRRRTDTAPAGLPHGGVPLRNGGGGSTGGLALFLRRRS